MDNFLKRIGLIKEFGYSLSVSQAAFVDALKLNIDKGATGFFFSGFEAFSSSNNLFKGSVDYEGFEIRKRQRFFERNHFAIAEGKIKSHQGKLEIVGRVNGFPKTMWILIGFFILGVAMVIFLPTIGGGSNPMAFDPIFRIVFPSMLFVALIVNYFVARYSVKRMQEDVKQLLVSCGKEAKLVSEDT